MPLKLSYVYMITFYKWLSSELFVWNIEGRTLTHTDGQGKQQNSKYEVMRFFHKYGRIYFMLYRHTMVILNWTYLIWYNLYMICFISEYI